jgi:hypothetical protein
VIFRPFDAVEQNFRIEMFDRWNNYSQPYETSLVPLEEIVLPGRVSSSEYIWELYDFDNWRLRGDMYHSGSPFEWVHDGTSSYWNPYSSIGSYVPGESGFVFPFYFTVDMGRKALYSRLNIKARNTSPTFSMPMPSNFEIWGTNNPKLATEVGDGSSEANLAYWTSWEIAGGTDAWKSDGWTKIATCKLLLSSGEEAKYYAGMVLSEIDMARYTTTGFDFNVNEGVTEGFRYLRWVINDTSTSQNFCHISEIAFWGKYMD